MNARTLLVVGDRIVDSPDHGPRKDFLELARVLGADSLSASDIDAYGGRTRSGLQLARVAAGRASSYEHLYCDSEHIGIPLAWMIAGREKGPRLTMIAHFLTPWKKRLACQVLRPARAISTVALHSPTQIAQARACGFSEGQIEVIPYQVDSAFWSPRNSKPRHVLSVGQEFRDYGTLIEALGRCDVRVEVAAGSFWSSREVAIDARSAPRNVHVGRRSYTELLDLYAESHFVVIPLHDVDFQAGIIAILESMSMGKAVIVTRTRGQTGVISGRMFHDGHFTDVGERAFPRETGVYVPARDPASLRGAVEYLLNNPEIAAEMGRAGRAAVESTYTIEAFTQRLSRIITGARESLAEPAT